MSWLHKLKQGLQKTSVLFSKNRAGTDEWEAALLRSDMGVKITEEILSEIQQKKPANQEQMLALIRQSLIQKMQPVASDLPVIQQTPTVFLMVGVNGAGKTTTIGKLAHQYMGKTMAFIAGDTFRAGAVNQLKHWAEKTGADFYAGKENCDAAGFIYDALKTCLQKQTQVVFIDTAGRLQNRTDLMDELKKIYRVIQKVDVHFPHYTILVLDATVGQNALSQVQLFNEVCPVSGLVMTKLDGTAKGGILVALADQFRLPIYAIGVGEGIEDFNTFYPEQYVDALLGE